MGTRPEFGCADSARKLAFARETIAALAKRAEGGSREAAEYLAGWLARYPAMKSLVRQLDDLATRVERAWVGRLCGEDAVAEAALEAEVAALKADLLGPSPTAADKVLAAAVVVAHLAHGRAALAAARPADTPEVRAATEKVLTVAQKRLADAVRAWELVAGRKAKGARPRGKVRLFEPGAAV